MIIASVASFLGRRYDEDTVQKIRSLSSVQKILIVVGSIVLIVGLVWFGASRTTQQTYVVKRGTLTNSLQVTGTYKTAADTAVTSPTNGILTDIYVANNTEVKKGDKLFHVESTATEDQKRTAYASYLSDKSALDADNALMYSLQSTMFSKWKTYFDLATNATYENSNNTPNTTNRILTEFTTAQDDWLAAEAAYKNQKTVVAKDEAALSSSELSYQETQSVTVTSPVAGTVVNLQAVNGDEVDTTSSVLVVADLSHPVVVVPVNEVNIPLLSVGQKADITFDALPDQHFSGMVTHIDTVGTKTQGEVTYMITLSVGKPSDQIKPSMTANVTIETLRKSGVLIVPNSAMTQKGGKNYVQKQGEKNFTEVRIGARGLTDSEVTSGLNEGDTVIIPQ